MSVRNCNLLVLLFVVLVGGKSTCNFINKRKKLPKINDAAYTFEQRMRFFFCVILFMCFSLCICIMCVFLLVSYSVSCCTICKISIYISFVLVYTCIYMYVQNSAYCHIRASMDFGLYYLILNYITLEAKKREHSIPRV